MKALPFLLCATLLAAEPRPLKGPLVTCDGWPQATDLVSWTRDVMRIENLENAPETARGKAFFEWLRLFSRMAVGGMIQAYEGEYGKERYVTDLHKTLFVYGWGYCDTTSRIAEAAWKEYRGDPLAAERVITQHEDGGYHTMYRLRLDGRHGAFDPRYGYYLTDRDAPDARVLDWPEVGDDRNLLANRGYRHRSRPYFEILGLEWERALLLQPAFHASEAAWRAAGAPKENVFGDSAYRMGALYHDMDFTLPRGAAIERFWDNAARKFYVPAGKHTEREYAFLPSGRFYRVTEASHERNWPKHDPNYVRARPYLVTVPRDEGYPRDLAGGKTIGQAWGELRYQAPLAGGHHSDALAPGATLVHSAAAPYLRPARTGAAGEAVFDIASPYILVDGVLDATLAGAGTRIEIRTLLAKPLRPTDADVWSSWQTIVQTPGRARVELGRSRFNGRDVSVHGVYRFQLRVAVPADAARTAPPGLTSLALRLAFENGVMSIPRLQAGRNLIRFRLRDAARLRAPVRIVYRYQTAAGPREAARTLRPADFRDNQASYILDAPGLERCRSLAISY